jgi:ribonucleotide monophosphatase NagD (HAD superfamily)
VLSNTAAHLPEHAADRYRDFGLDLEAGRILTSGMHLAQHFREHNPVGCVSLVRGLQDSRVYVERAGG